MGEVKRMETVFCWRDIDSDKYEGPLWPFVKEKILSHGDRVVLVNPYTQEEYSCTRVVSLAEQLSRGMRKMGVKEGTCVCLFAPNSIENVLLVHATMAAGAILHPANFSISKEELRRQLEMTEPVIIFTTSQLLETVQLASQGKHILIVVIGARDGNLNFQDLMGLGTEDVTLPLTFGDPEQSVTWVVFSSGTTGPPKAVEHTQRNVRAWISIYYSTPGCLKVGDSIVSFTPLHHVSGLTTSVSHLVGGVRLVLLSSFDLHQYLAFVEQYKSSFLFLPPPLVTKLVKNDDLKKYDLSHLQCVFSGGQSLCPGVEKQFTDKFGIPMAQVYGMTELMAITGTQNGHREGSVGIPLPGVILKIVSLDSGKSVGPNQSGELCVRCPFAMKGYSKDKAATDQVIDGQGWLHTGDLAHVDTECFLYITGRLKDIIKVRDQSGVRLTPVAPSEVEDILLRHPAIADVALVGRVDETYGEVPVAFVVTRPDHVTPTENDVIAFVKDNAPDHMQLRGGVVFIDQIPRTPMGKPLRHKLLEDLEPRTHNGF